MSRTGAYSAMKAESGLSAWSERSGEACERAAARRGDRRRGIRDGGGGLESDVGGREGETGEAGCTEIEGTFGVRFERGSGTEGRSRECGGRTVLFCGVMVLF